MGYFISPANVGIKKNNEFLNFMACLKLSKTGELTVSRKLADKLGLMLEKPKLAYFVFLEHEGGVYIALDNKCNGFSGYIQDKDQYIIQHDRYIAYKGLKEAFFEKFGLTDAVPYLTATTSMPVEIDGHVPCFLLKKMKNAAI